MSQTEIVFERRGFDAAIALPHGQQFAAEPDVLLDDVQLLRRADSIERVALFRQLEFFRQQLHVTPDNRERVAQVVHKFGGSLAERCQPLFLR